MSTPRRPAPRSSPAPITATGRGVSTAFTAENHTQAVMSVGGPIKVLLADDDPLFLESLQALIEGQPELTVVATANDGVGTLTRLRRDHPHLCLIVLTGDSDGALHVAATEAGADAVLEKHELARG